MEKNQPEDLWNLKLESDKPKRPSLAQRIASTVIEITAYLLITMVIVGAALAAIFIIVKAVAGLVL